MSDVLLAGEEPQERPAPQRDVITDRPPQRRIRSLERVQDGSLGGHALDGEFYFSVDVCQVPKVEWKCNADHVRTGVPHSASTIRNKRRWPSFYHPLLLAPERLK